MSNSSVESRFEILRTVAVEAGRLTLQHFQRSDLTFERKGDQSPVTVADRGAETFLRDRISQWFPEDAILGEEFGETSGSSGFRWILDPIDGTKSFISGVPLYGTMVAVEQDQQAIMGCVYLPGLDEGVFAAQGRGCWHFRDNQEPTRCHVSQTDRLSDAVFVTSEVKTYDERESRGAYEALEQAAYVTRTWGDCYGYLLVATGRVDLMIDPIMNVWDAAAVQPILTEAGGQFTDWQGQPSIHSGEGIGTNPALLDSVLAITRQYPRPANAR